MRGKILKNGFTLIELMVGVVLFSIISTVVTTIFISGFRGQERALKFQTLFDQTNFLMEYTARAIRMARKSTTTSCLSTTGMNYELTRGGLGLKFITSECGCQEIYLDAATGRIKEEKLGVPDYLTSEDLEVTNLVFNLIGESQTDELQARVTIFMKIRGKGNRAETQPEVSLETTVSQRKLDMQQ